MSLNLNLNKSKWKTVKFGDVVAEPKESVVNIAASDIKHVIGLEHIDAESIHLRRYAGIEESTTFTKRFSVGDVLFGRRRAYLKKAALAPFEGICSGDITVFRVKKDLLPELLPFIVNNEKFFDYAVKHSAGGLSPRVKFKDLADYEFLLPPKEQQAELAELLWAMDEVIEKDLVVLNKLETILNSYIWQIFTSNIIESKKVGLLTKSLFQTKWEERCFPENWRSLILKDVISDCQNGFAEGEREETGIPQLRMNNVTRTGRIDLEKIAMIPMRGNYDRYLIGENDVLFCSTNSEDLVGKSIIATNEIEGFTYSNHFTRLRANSELLNQKFLYLWLKFNFDIGLFERLCTRWIGQAAVQSESLLRLQIILPPIEEQIIASKKCESIEDRIKLLETQITTSKNLLKSLINEVF